MWLPPQEYGVETRDSLQVPPRRRIVLSQPGKDDTCTGDMNSEKQLTKLKIPVPGAIDPNKTESDRSTAMRNPVSQSILIVHETPVRCKPQNQAAYSKT